MHRREGSFLASKHPGWPWTIYVETGHPPSTVMRVRSTNWVELKFSHKLRTVLLNCYVDSRVLWGCHHSTPNNFLDAVAGSRCDTRGSWYQRRPLDKYRGSSRYLPIGRQRTRIYCIPWDTERYLAPFLRLVRWFLGKSVTWGQGRGIIESRTCTKRDSQSAGRKMERIEFRPQIW